MISKDHKKHSDIARPSLGNFGRNEFAIGRDCCLAYIAGRENFRDLRACDCRRRSSEALALRNEWKTRPR